MEVSKVSSVKNQSFTSNVKEEKQSKTPEQIKDGKKKLALALAALGAAAVAGVAIYKNKGGIKRVSNSSNNFRYNSPYKSSAVPLGVRFGFDKPLMEVELNELQELMLFI